MSWPWAVGRDGRDEHGKGKGKGNGKPAHGGLHRGEWL